MWEEAASQLLQAGGPTNWADSGKEPRGLFEGSRL